MNNLTEIIYSRIKEQGAITFAQFMELALYHPMYGYYCSGQLNIGKEGDFYTSPHVHKAFGAVLTNFIAKTFDLMENESFTVIEPGAEKGFLALDILNHLKDNYPIIYLQTTYYIIDKNSASSIEVKSFFRDHQEKVKIFTSLDEIERNRTCGVVLSNELFDAMPFHRLKIIDGTLNEVYVILKNGELSEIYGKPSNNEIVEYFNNIETRFEEGQEFEINLHVKNFFSTIDEILSEGIILSVDYGYLAQELFDSHRTKGTYKCLYKHTINENPYTNIGNQDITAHVDFSNMISTGESLNINKVEYTTQAQFLLDWGILKTLEAESEKDIQSIKNLFLPELMGDKFKVLIQEKNLHYKIDTFYPESPFKISFKVL